MVYFHPEKHGLTTIGEIEWEDEAYQFDITALWWREADERFYMAEDSGCSCPSPFESHTMESLEPVVSLTDLKSRLRQRMKQALVYKPQREAELRDETDRLLALARERGLRP